jgi:hypothetical protein
MAHHHTHHRRKRGRRAGRTRKWSRRAGGGMNASAAADATNSLVQGGREASSSSSRMRTSQCHPSVLVSAGTNTLQRQTGNHRPVSCFSDETLRTMRNAWNQRHPDDKITSDDPKTIHERMAEAYRDSCHQEQCWLRHMDMLTPSMRKSLRNAFAPTQPDTWKRNPTEWLSNVDIQRVMKQYEEAYPHFDFLGPAPMDFDTRMWNGQCAWNELCRFQLAKQIRRGKTHMGIVFNTDAHDQPGQHWISMFVDTTKKSIFYFDSVADPPTPEILALVERIQTQAKPTTYSFASNEGNRHQRGNTECGVYCLYFIISVLTGVHPVSFFQRHKIPDKEMQSFRNVFFNPNDDTSSPKSNKKSK